MTSLRRGAAGSAVLALLFFGTAVAQEELPQPGPEHDVLKDLVGTWDTEFKSADGTAESKGVATYTMECGGLWLASNFEGEFDGQKFQGRGLDGYDPKSKKYVGVWVDSMLTRPMFFEGDYDKATKTMTMWTTYPGPDGKPAKWKSVSVTKDKDHLTFQMFLTPEGGQESLMMTIEYTRRR